MNQRTGPGRPGAVDLSGQWHALWQTTAEGVPTINTEVVAVRQSGTRLLLENLERSPEDPVGGYLWRGQARLYDNQHLLGSYTARERGVGSKGTFYFVASRGGKYLLGKWVGCNLDSNLAWGFAALAKDRETGMDKLRALLGRHGAGRPWPAGAAPGTPLASTPEIV